jgi:hypothetical protein
MLIINVFWGWMPQRFTLRYETSAEWEAKTVEGLNQSRSRAESSSTLRAFKRQWRYENLRRLVACLLAKFTATSPAF